MSTIEDGCDWREAMDLNALIQKKAREEAAKRTQRNQAGLTQSFVNKIKQLTWPFIFIR